MLDQLTYEKDHPAQAGASPRPRYLRRAADRAHGAGGRRACRQPGLPRRLQSLLGAGQGRAEAEARRRSRRRWPRKARAARTSAWRSRRGRRGRQIRPHRICRDGRRRARNLPGWRRGPSPAAPTRSASIWPAWARPSSATSNMAARTRAGAAPLPTSCICMPAASISRRPDGGRLQVTAPLPPHMVKSWKMLGFDPDDRRDPVSQDQSRPSLWRVRRGTGRKVRPRKEIRTQKAKRQPRSAPQETMKRFYKEAAAEQTPDGFRILLDGKPVKTPARHTLLLPTPALAEAIARRMARPRARRSIPPPCRCCGWPTRCWMASRQRADVIAAILRFGEHDLLCYRAETPASWSRARPRNGIRCWTGRRSNGARISQ